MFLNFITRNIFWRGKIDDRIAHRMLNLHVTPYLLLFWYNNCYLHRAMKKLIVVITIGIFMWFHQGMLMYLLQLLHTLKIVVTTSMTHLQLLNPLDQWCDRSWLGCSSLSSSDCVNPLTPHLRKSTMTFSNGHPTYYTWRSFCFFYTAEFK